MRSLGPHRAAPVDLNGLCVCAAQGGVRPTLGGVGLPLRAQDDDTPARSLAALTGVVWALPVCQAPGLPSQGSPAAAGACGCTLEADSGRDTATGCSTAWSAQPPPL